jgi:hypothetical protein
MLRGKKERTGVKIGERPKQGGLYGYHPIEWKSKMKFLLKSISPGSETGEMMLGWQHEN